MTFSPLFPEILFFFKRKGFHVYKVVSELFFVLKKKASPCYYFVFEIGSQGRAPVVEVLAVTATDLLNRGSGLCVCCTSGPACVSGIESKFCFMYTFDILKSDN